MEHEALKIRELCVKIGFEYDAAVFFEEAYAKCYRREDIINDFDSALDNFFCCDTYEYVDILKNIAKKTEVPEYSVNMLFLLISVEKIHDTYISNGINDCVFYETIKDFGYKLNECKKLYGVWGTFVIRWYKHFVDNNVVQLGRLQYEKINMPYKYKNIAEKGDTVIACHIPSCGPLDIQEVIDSLKAAYCFYACEGTAVFVCESWMLYPLHYMLFPEGSNLRGFYDLFDVINKRDNDNSDIWRIFSKTDAKDIDDLPQDTRLQSNFIKYLSAGNQMGIGFGVLLFDGKGVIKA